MAKQPNVLIVMTDQHHPRVMGCAGDPIAVTPTMDALAARGTRFEHAYTASPLCGPSRAAFMTGRMPSSMDCLTNQRQFDSDLPTFAHMFGEAGYETVLAGRMHFNGPDQRHGFSKRIIGDVTGVYVPHMPNLKEILGDLSNTTGPSANAIVKSGPGRSGYQAYDEAVAGAAADWLSSRDDDRPFMMTVGFVLPHAPFVAPPEDFDYFDKRITEEDLPKASVLHPEMMRLQKGANLVGDDVPTKQDQRRARVAYYGMCRHVDRQMKRILDALDEAGLTDDTIVVYTSDHGEQIGEHGMWWKHTFYEASVGVPMIFAGLGVPQGQTVSQNVSLLDVGATVLDMVGATPIPGEIQGASFRCLMNGDAAAWHDTTYSENLWPPTAACLHRMVKRGPWKLNHYHGHEPQLFNVDDDPGEMLDRADDPACADIRAELTALVLRDWDHDAVLARQRTMREMEMIALRAREGNDLPEPDALWHDGAIENWFDAER